MNYLRVAHEDGRSEYVRILFFPSDLQHVIDFMQFIGELPGVVTVSLSISTQDFE